MICGALRLARFNVQTACVDRRFFIGLPTPAAAGVVAAVVILLEGEPPGSLAGDRDRGGHLRAGAPDGLHLPLLVVQGDRLRPAPPGGDPAGRSCSACMIVATIRECLSVPALRRLRCRGPRVRLVGATARDRRTAGGQGAPATRTDVHAPNPTIGESARDEHDYKIARAARRRYRAGSHPGRPCACSRRSAKPPGSSFEFEQALVGGAAIDATGGPLPAATLKLCRQAPRHPVRRGGRAEVGQPAAGERARAGAAAHCARSSISSRTCAPPRAFPCWWTPPRSSARWSRAPISW